MDATWKSLPTKNLQGLGLLATAPCSPQGNICHPVSSPSMSDMEPLRGLQRRLTQTLHQGVQCGPCSRIHPCTLGVEVVCHSDDDGQQHGEQALFEEGDHLGKRLQCPLVHFLVGILKPWGESIKDLLREQKPGAHGNPGWEESYSPATLGRGSSCLPAI